LISTAVVWLSAVCRLTFLRRDRLRRETLFLSGRGFSGFESSGAADLLGAFSSRLLFPFRSGVTVCNHHAIKK
jgi:hypothetical protein